MFPKNHKYIFLIIVWMVPILLSGQCAMCRAVLESEEGQKAAEGINNGILYLMSIPYILVFGLGVYIYKSWKKSK